ncbi:glycosyl transferase [Streptomyces sp. NPDC020965]|uniref:glycosyl transferase n=1 Tax=Streptomyces sp. NPDC020965 TaxID=3365105 RepID=UPI003791F414
MPDILFLSRGHGFGHAARDLRIIRSMRRQRPDVRVTLLAAGSAVDYYRMRDIPCWDLGITDAEDMTRGAAEKVWRTLAGIARPDLVVSDEVLWAMPFCRKIWKLDCLLLTDWFYAERGLPEHDAYLDHATGITVLDFSAAHPGPFRTTAPVTFKGPVVEEFPGDRASARRGLGIDGGTEMTVLTLGGMAARAESRRMTRAALDAWSAHASPGSALFVLADHPGDGFGPAPDRVVWTGLVPDPERYYRAADLVVADAMGTSVCDLIHNGVPVLGMTDPEACFPTSFDLRVDRLNAAGLLVAAGSGTAPDDLWDLAERARKTTGKAADPDRRDSFEWTTGDEMAADLLSRLP